MNKTNHHVQIAEPIEGRAINFHKLIFIKPRTSHVNVGKMAYSAREFLLASIRACTSWIETRSLLILRLTNSRRQVSTTRSEISDGIERDVEVRQSYEELGILENLTRSDQVLHNVWITPFDQAELDCLYDVRSFGT